MTPRLPEIFLGQKNQLPPKFLKGYIWWPKMKPIKCLSDGSLILPHPYIWPVSWPLLAILGYFWSKKLEFEKSKLFPLRTALKEAEGKCVSLFCVFFSNLPKCAFLDIFLDIFVHFWRIFHLFFKFIFCFFHIFCDFSNFFCNSCPFFAFFEEKKLIFFLKMTFTSHFQRIPSNLELFLHFWGVFHFGEFVLFFRFCSIFPEKKCAFFENYLAIFLRLGIPSPEWKKNVSGPNFVSFIFIICLFSFFF